MRHLIYDSNLDIEDFEISMQRLAALVLATQIVAITDLGLWNGRRNGYRACGNRLDAIVKFHVRSSEGYRVFYDDETDEVEAEDIHHDGANRYRFRSLRKGHGIDEVEDAVLVEGTPDEAKVENCTSSLGMVFRRIFGFKRKV